MGIPFKIEMIDDQMAAILRQKTPQERLQMVNRMWVSARKMIAGKLRTEHPDWSQEQINREIAHRMSHGLVKNEPR